MNQSIEQWTTALCAVTVLGAIVSLLTTGGKYEKLLRLILTAMTVLILVEPISGLSNINIELPNVDEAQIPYQSYSSTIDNQILDTAEQLTEGMLIEELKSITDKINKISVNMYYRTSGSISIERVEIGLYSSTPEQVNVITERVAERLSIDRSQIVIAEDN